MYVSAISGPLEIWKQELPAHRSCITYLKNIELAMDTHGLTWTNTFIHARQGMNKTPDASGM